MTKWDSMVSDYIMIHNEGLMGYTWDISSTHSGVNRLFLPGGGTQLVNKTPAAVFCQRVVHCILGLRSCYNSRTDYFPRETAGFPHLCEFAGGYIHSVNTQMARCDLWGKQLWSDRFYANFTHQTEDCSNKTLLQHIKKATTYGKHN